MMIFRSPRHGVPPGLKLLSCRHFIPSRGIISPRRLYSTESPRSDPLRILFCGSDSFSCASLSALETLKKGSPDLVKSIDVVVRPPKPAGRGLALREVAAHQLATTLGLPTWELDTFTGWDMPRPEGEDINLIVAVSFGLWVPERLLNQAKYGGLNVHPSLLPNLRGPAPIHHAILHGIPFTGVTLQTLSAENYDCGVRLLQVPPEPGLPIPKDSTVDSLLQAVTPLAAEALVMGIRQGRYLPPLEDRGWWAPPKGSPPKSKREKKLKEYHESERAYDSERVGSWDINRILMLAPKMRTEDQRIRWTKSWSADQLLRQYRAAGGLWTAVPPRLELKAPRLPPTLDGNEMRTFILKATSKEMFLDVVAEYANDEAKVTKLVAENSTDRGNPGDGDDAEHRPHDDCDRRRRMATARLESCIKEAIKLARKKPDPSVRDLTPASLTRDILKYLECLAYNIRVRQNKFKRVRLKFSEPEVLTGEEAKRVFERFNATDVGVEGKDPNLKYMGDWRLQNNKDRELEKPLGPRRTLQWVHWIDPVETGKSARDMGGRRNKPSSKMKYRLKADRVGDDLRISDSDSAVSAYAMGQVWMEEENGPGGAGFEDPEDRMSVLVPATKGGKEPSVFRIRKINVDGEGWYDAAKVLRKHIVDLDPTRLMESDYTYVGASWRANGVPLGDLSERLKRPKAMGGIRKSLDPGSNVLTDQEFLIRSKRKKGGPPGRRKPLAQATEGLIFAKVTQDSKNEKSGDAKGIQVSVFRKANIERLREKARQEWMAMNELKKEEQNAANSDGNDGNYPPSNNLVKKVTSHIGIVDGVEKKQKRQELARLGYVRATRIDRSKL